MENFDAMAVDFDTERRVDRAEEIVKEIRKHISDGHKKSAIEYGCGTGLIGLQLVEDFEVVLFVDSSPEMLKRLETKLEPLRNPNISTLCCDFTEHIPENLHTDYIFSSLVLHHIRETESAFRVFYQILNSDGRLFIVDIDEDNGCFHADYPDFDGHNGFDHTTLISLAQKAGFSATTIRTFYHANKFINGEKAPYSLFILDASK